MESGEPADLIYMQYIYMEMHLTYPHLLGGGRGCTTCTYIFCVFVVLQDGELFEV